MVLKKKQFLAAAAGVIFVLSVTAVGWAVIESQTGRSPESSTLGSSASPTLPPTGSVLPSASPVSPSPTQSPTQSPAQSPASTPTPSSPPARSVSDGLCLSMSLEKTLYMVGEPVNITLAIINVSDQIVSFTHTGMDFDFVVYNGTDSVVYRWSTGRAFPMFITVKPLQPGQNVTATYVWPQTCNNLPSAMGVSVSPGTYYIDGESGQAYGLRTAPTQIVIVSS
jgi:hypothetical protein